ncbi:MAG: hypothetical protein ACAI38_22740 [Myxococcota bacterium]|nr:hypothetical protein [Myxococcota bacterium]
MAEKKKGSQPAALSLLRNEQPCANYLRLAFLREDFFAFFLLAFLVAFFFFAVAIANLLEGG